MSVIERLELWKLLLQLADFSKAWHSPEILDSALFRIIELHILAVIVDRVMSKGMLSILLRWQLVDHRVLWQEEGTLTHLICLVKKFQLESVEADGSCQLLTVVMS